MEKTKFERNLKRIEVYQDLLKCYENGESIDSIKGMIGLDYIKYMRKLKYSFNKIKDSYNYNNPTVIQDEDDLTDVNTAFDYLKNKINFLNSHNIYRDNFYDLVLKQKEDFINENDGISIDSLLSMIEYDINLFEENKILDRFIEKESDESLNAFSKQEENTTGIKTNKEKEIKKLAIELIKKENN